VDGVLNAEERGCGANGAAFHGTLDGNRISGTLRGGHGNYRFKVGATATGDLSETTLDLTLTEPSQFPFPIPGGRMSLHR